MTPEEELRIIALSEAVKTWDNLGQILSRQTGRELSRTHAIIDTAFEYVKFLQTGKGTEVPR